MPLESGTYVNDLVESNPVGSDDRSLGDNHLRLLKSVLKTTFPNASKSFRFPTSVALQTSTVTVVFPDDQNKVFPIDATAGAVAVNLPDPTSGGTVNEDGFAVTVFKVDSSINIVTVNASGGQLINGAATITLSVLNSMLHLVWCKLAARWLAITPNILNSLLLSEGTLQSLNADNTSAEKSHILLQRGSGAGNAFSLRTLGDAANGVLGVRPYIGSGILGDIRATFINLYKNFFVADGVNPSEWGVLTSGYMFMGDLATLGFTPGAGDNYLYFKSGILRAMSATGGERNLEAAPTATKENVVFTASNTWTKDANLSYVNVHVVGGGGGNSAGTGGTSSFGAHCSATGGAPNGGAGGTGSGGDVNLTGGRSLQSGGTGGWNGGAGAGPFGGVMSLGEADGGTQEGGKNYGGGAARNGGAGAGAGGGYSMKTIPVASLGATETVTVGAGGDGAVDGAPGIVVVEEFYFS